MFEKIFRPILVIFMFFVGIIFIIIVCILFGFNSTTIEKDYEE